MSVDLFKQTNTGTQVMDLLNRADIVSGLIVVSHHGLPALQELSRHLVPLNIDFTDADKKNIGKCVREVMEANGWTTDATSRSTVKPNTIFKTGAVYRQRSTPILVEASNHKLKASFDIQGV